MKDGQKHRLGSWSVVAALLAMAALLVVITQAAARDWGGPAQAAQGKVTPLTAEDEQTPTAVVTPPP